MNDIVEEIKLFKAQQQEEDTVETESYDITELIDCVNLHAYMIKESFEYENLTVDELEFYIESTLETIREEADTETDSLVDGVEEAYENNKTNPSKTVFIDPDAIETMKDFRDFKRELNSGNIKNKYKRLANDVPSFIPKSLQVPDYWKTPSAKLKEKESLLDASKRTRKELDELKERIDKKGHTVGDKDLTDLDNFIVDNLSDAHKGQLKRLKSIKASDGSFGKRYKMEYFGDTDLDIYYESDNGTADDAKQGIIKTIINKIKAFVQRLIQRYKMWKSERKINKLKKMVKDPEVREDLSKCQVSSKHLLDEECMELVNTASRLIDQIYEAFVKDKHASSALVDTLNEYCDKVKKYIEDAESSTTEKTDNCLHQAELLVKTLDQMYSFATNFLKLDSFIDNHIDSIKFDIESETVMSTIFGFLDTVGVKLVGFIQKSYDEYWKDNLYNEGVDIMSNYESYETDDITIDDVDAYIESMTDNLNNAKALRDQMVQEETEYEDYKCEFVNTNDFVFESDTEELLTDAEFFDESYEPDNSPLINASNNCIQFYQEFTLAELMGVGAIIGGCIAMIKPFLDLKKFGRFPKDLMRVFEIVKSENFEASENKKALKKALKAVSKDLNYLTGPYAGTATWTVNERKELRELARITNNIVHGGAYGTSILRKNKKQSEKVLKLLKKRDEELDAAGVSKKMQLRTGAANAITEWMV